MRASRLLSILLILQARGRMTARALASEFEVSIRTIYRDVDELSAAGVPVYAERGPEGGFQLLEGYRTTLTGLTPPEAETLFLLGLPGPAADLGLGPAVLMARRKLNAALPEDRRQSADRVASRIHLDPSGWYRTAEPLASLPILAEAVWQARRIHAGYESWSARVERVLNPLGLVIKGGVWYLVALADDHRPRTYRVSSFTGVTLLSETFARPKAFDLAAHWRDSTREFEDRLRRDRAVLRVTEKGMKQIGRLASAVERMAAATRSASDEAGWIRVTIPIESVDHAAAELLQFGPDVEALEPETLRRRLGELAAEVAALYGREGPRA